MLLLALLLCVAVGEQVIYTAALRTVNRNLAEAIQSSRMSAEESSRQAELARHGEATALRLRTADEVRFIHQSLAAGEVELGLRQRETGRDRVEGTYGKGFVSGHLDLLASNRLRLLRGHHLGVQSVAVSPDGQLIASGALDRKVILWDSTDGRMIATLVGHVTPVFRVAFSGDGRTLLTCGVDRDRVEIKLWDVDSRREWSGVPEFSSIPYAFWFSPDGRHLITAGGRSSSATTSRSGILAWPLDRVRHRITGPPQEARAIAAAGDDRDGESRDHILARLRRRGGATLVDGRVLAVLKGLHGAAFQVELFDPKTRRAIGAASIGATGAHFMTLGAADNVAADGSQRSLVSRAAAIL
ncbi:MAG: hypothetical protein K2X91_14705, partial [Thermoleophilia bacterium]|nr:hypothetical protein [Thermoleophilia bacterium]